VFGQHKTKFIQNILIHNNILYLNKNIFQHLKSGNSKFYHEGKDKR